VKRLRLRGDWSDTGPGALPLGEMGAREGGQPSQEQGAAAGPSMAPIAAGLP